MKILTVVTTAVIIAGCAAPRYDHSPETHERSVQVALGKPVMSLSDNVDAAFEVSPDGQIAAITLSGGESGDRMRVAQHIERTAPYQPHTAGEPLRYMVQFRPAQEAEKRHDR